MPRNGKVLIGKAAKVAYVLRQPQTRRHHCHWPGCTVEVPPAMFSCRKHWFRLPKHLREMIWATYEPGQEVNGTPSAEYLAVVREVLKWVREREERKCRGSTT